MEGCVFVHCLYGLPQWHHWWYVGIVYADLYHGGTQWILSSAVSVLWQGLYQNTLLSALFSHTRYCSDIFFIKVGVWGNFKLPVGKKLAVRALSCSFQTKSLRQRRCLEVNVVHYYTSSRWLIIILNGCAGKPAVLVLLVADFAHLPKGIITIVWKY